MDVAFKNLEHSTIEITFKLSKGESNVYIENAIKKLGEGVEINGFRKGKAPRDVVIQHFGQSVIIREAASVAIKDNYIKAVKEKHLEPIGQPQVEITKLAFDNPLEFKIIASVIPSIELPDYKGISSQVQSKEIELDPGEVEKTLIQLQKSRAKFTVKNDVAQKGDWVEVEINIKPAQEEDKIEITQPNIKDSFILGEGHLLPDIEKEIIGMKTGQTKDFSFIYPPEYYQKNLAGKKVLSHLNLKSVQRIDLPDISDKFAQGLGHFKDLNDLKHGIKEGIVMEKKQQESQRIKQEILDKIAQKVNIDIPNILINKEKERMLNQLKTDVTSQLKIKFDDYLKKIGKTEEQVVESFSPVITKRIKEFLILKEIGKKEKIEISDKEIDERVNQILSQKNLSGNKDIKNTVDLDRLKAYTKEEMFNGRTLDKLEGYSSNKKKTT